MSGPQDVACATCHHPQNAYAEDRDLSLGVTGIGLGRFRRDGHLVKRNSPTVLNVAFNGIDESGRYDPATAPAFWDNRIKSLESQALEPLKSFEEMRGDTYPEDEAVARVVAKLQANAEYPSLFAEAFGSEQPVNAENLGRATLERAVLDRRRFQSQAEARLAIFQWLEGWYTPHRRHSALGYLSPINYPLPMCSRRTGWNPRQNARSAGPGGSFWWPTGTSSPPPTSSPSRSGRHAA